MVVTTGSHHLGPKACAVLVILESDSTAAAQYEVNIITIFTRFHKAAAATVPASAFFSVVGPTKVSTTWATFSRSAIGHITQFR